MIGAKDELPSVESIAGRLAPQTRARVVHTAGRLTIGQLPAPLEGAGCVLSNDTRPMLANSSESATLQRRGIRLTIAHDSIDQQWRTPQIERTSAWFNDPSRGSFARCRRWLNSQVGQVC
jgi:hypothetical protein